MSDLSSRYLLGCDAHPAISLERTQAHFKRLFETYGLPNRIRTDNGVPFASNALARLSQLSVRFIRLGIYPELIEPGKPQQNGVHERMHKTLKEEVNDSAGEQPERAAAQVRRLPAPVQRRSPPRSHRHETAGGALPAVTPTDAPEDRPL